MLPKPPNRSSRDPESSDSTNPTLTRKVRTHYESRGFSRVAIDMLCDEIESRCSDAGLQIATGPPPAPSLQRQPKHRRRQPSPPFRPMCLFAGGSRFRADDRAEGSRRLFGIRRTRSPAAIPIGLGIPAQRFPRSVQGLPYGPRVPRLPLDSRLVRSWAATVFGRALE